MRLSGGVAILGEGPDPRDGESRAEQAEHATPRDEAASPDAEPLQDETASGPPC